MRNINEYLNQIKNKRLLIVFPHPDDESFNTGGLIQRARSLGFKVQTITLTKGGRGKNYSKKTGAVAQIRFEELQNALKIIGFDQMEVWDYPDGSLKDDRDWSRRLRHIVKREKPGLIVTYDHSGMSGHPDHIALSVEIFKLVKEIGGINLMWASWPGKLRRFMVNKEVKDFAPRFDLRLDLNRKEHDNKCKAIKVHESQLGTLSWWHRLLLKRFICSQEYFAIADLSREYDHKFVEFKF